MKHYFPVLTCTRQRNYCCCRYCLYIAINIEHIKPSIFSMYNSIGYNRNIYFWRSISSLYKYSFQEIHFATAFIYVFLTFCGVYFYITKLLLHNTITRNVIIHHPVIKLKRALDDGFTLCSGFLTLLLYKYNIRTKYNTNARYHNTRPPLKIILIVYVLQNVTAAGPRVCNTPRARENVRS